jgi:hypothetical protein
MRIDGPQASPERRQFRSTDPLVALHYQLSSTRARGEVDTLVVAGVGSWPVCEELAAYAPLLAEGAEATTSDTVNSRVETLRREVEVRLLSVGDQDVLLCAHRQRRHDAHHADTVPRDVDRAADGVRRILSQRNDALR